MICVVIYYFSITSVKYDYFSFYLRHRHIFDYLELKFFLGTRKAHKIPNFNFFMNQGGTTVVFFLPETRILSIFQSVLTELK